MQIINIFIKLFTSNKKHYATKAASKSCIKQAMLMHHTATLTVILIFHDYQNKDANNGSIAISVRMLAKFHGNSIDKAF